MLAGVVLTVFAPLLPTIGEDFQHRTEVPAHRYASPARPVVARPVTSGRRTRARRDVADRRPR
jgi:hypothetical protein